MTADSKQEASAKERPSNSPSQAPSSAPAASDAPSASASVAPASDRPASQAPASAAPPANDDANAASDPPDDPPNEADALRTELAELKERMLRNAADVDNFRKRKQREVEEARLRGKDDAVLELLPVFDNLERAVRAADTGATDAVIDGVKMVLKLFEDTAQRMGLNRVKSIGQRFDPLVHEAVQKRETDEAPPGTIVDEIAPGYLFGQRLLRAAMVVVAAPKPKASSEPAPSTPPQAGDGQEQEASDETRESTEPTESESGGAPA